MRKYFSNLFETYVISPLRKVPGEEKFGNYRFLPLFFLFGASVEFLMVHLKAGPNKANFCTLIYYIASFFAFKSFTDSFFFLIFLQNRYNFETKTS